MLGCFSFLPWCMPRSPLTVEVPLSAQEVLQIEAAQCLTNLDDETNFEIKKRILETFLSYARQLKELLIKGHLSPEEASLFRLFLSKGNCFAPGKEKRYYLNTFRQLLDVIPAKPSPDKRSLFDWQDALGLNALMRIVEFQDPDLLDTYLDHPKVQAEVDPYFADIRNLKNVFSIVYSLKTEEEKLNVVMLRRLFDKLIQPRSARLFLISFNIDALRGVLKNTKPIEHGGCPYFNLRQAMIDFYDYRIRTHKVEDWGLSQAAYSALQNEMRECCPQLLEDERVKAILTDLAPGRVTVSPVETIHVDRSLSSPGGRISSVWKSSSCSTARKSGTVFEHSDTGMRLPGQVD